MSFNRDSKTWLCRSSEARKTAAGVGMSCCSKNKKFRVKVTLRSVPSNHHDAMAGSSQSYIIERSARLFPRIQDLSRHHVVYRDIE